MNLKNLAILLCVGLLAACVRQPRTLISTTPFNPAEMAWAKGNGTNSVSGFAVLRTVGGEARTCAALPVRLVPDSPLARERMIGLYGTTTRGTAPASARNYDDAKTDPEYLSASRETRCDPQGNFSFEKVPNGVWYVTTIVAWSAAPRARVLEGGPMMKRIELTGNQAEKVSLP